MSLIVRFALAVFVLAGLGCARRGRRADPVLRLDRRGAERRRARRDRDDQGQGGGRRDPARHLSRLPAHLRGRRRHGAPRHLRRRLGQARRRARAVPHQHQPRGHPRLHGRGEHLPLARQLHLPAQVHDRPSDPLLPRPYRAVLERHRQRLVLPDPRRPRRGSRCPTARRRCGGSRIPASTASAAATTTGKILGDNTLEVSTTRMLKPREGLSVAVEIPAGLVAPPSGTQGLWYWFLDNKRFAIGGLGFIGVLGFYLAAWNAVGRDPPKGDHHPAVPPTEGHLAGARRLRAATGAGARAAGGPSPPRRCRSPPRGCLSSTTRATTSSSPGPTSRNRPARTSCRKARR